MTSILISENLKSYIFFLETYNSSFYITILLETYTFLTEYSKNFTKYFEIFTGYLIISKGKLVINDSFQISKIKIEANTNFKNKTYIFNPKKNVLKKKYIL